MVLYTGDGVRGNNADETASKWKLITENLANGQVSEYP